MACSVTSCSCAALMPMSATAAALMRVAGSAAKTAARPLPLKVTCIAICVHVEICVHGTAICGLPCAQRSKAFLRAPTWACGLTCSRAHVHGMLTCSHAQGRCAAQTHAMHERSMHNRHTCMVAEKRVVFTLHLVRPPCAAAAAVMALAKRPPQKRTGGGSTLARVLTRTSS